MNDIYIELEPEKSCIVTSLNAYQQNSERYKMSLFKNRILEAITMQYRFHALSWIHYGNLFFPFGL